MLSQEITCVGSAHDSLKVISPSMCCAPVPFSQNYSCPLGSLLGKVRVNLDVSTVYQESGSDNRDSY